MRIKSVYLLLLFFLNGCSIFSSEDYPSLDSFSPLDKVAKEEFLNKLKNESDLLQTARGKFDVSLNNNLGSKTFKEVFVFQRPDNLRMEFFATGLNQLMGLILLRADVLYFYNLEENVLYLGENNPESFFKITQFPFSGEGLMLWFCAKYNPFLLASKEILVFRNSQTQQLAVQAKGDEGTSLIFFKQGANAKVNLGEYFIDSMEMRNKEGKTIFFSKTIFQDNLGAINKIEFSLPQERVKGSLDLQSLKYNPDLKQNFEQLFNYQKDLPIKYLN